MWWRNRTSAYSCLSGLYIWLRTVTMAIRTTLAWIHSCVFITSHLLEQCRYGRLQTWMLNFFALISWYLMDNIFTKINTSMLPEFLIAGKDLPYFPAKCGLIQFSFRLWHICINITARMIGLRRDLLYIGHLSLPQLVPILASIQNCWKLNEEIYKIFLTPTAFRIPIIRVLAVFATLLRLHHQLS